MIPVLAGTSLAFEYTAYDTSSGLSIAMKIYDVTTGSPSLVTTNVMTHVVNGTYVGYFTPVAGHQYLINKMVYTDPGTWLLPSLTYSPGSESIQASAEQTDLQTTLGNTNTLVTRLTSTRASNLDNLDVVTSSRASSAAVAAIPTNPLLTGDTRLNHLDANISSRATPSDVTAAEAAILAAISGGGGGSLTAAEVWSYVTRGLTAPVDTTDDLSSLAKTTDVTSALTTTLNAIPQFCCQISISIDPLTDAATFQVWLEQGNSTVHDSQTAEVTVYNSVGAPIITGLTSSTPSLLGIFTLTSTHASEVLESNHSYTALVAIMKNATTYETTKAFTVF